MLRELRIRDLAVIREAALELGSGFNVLTGETGAGKSVCVTALRAVMGGRIDADAVRPGAQSATLTAVFDDTPRAVDERLRALGVSPDDLLTLTREVAKAGRGSCRVNGALVSLAVLREVGDLLADVTTQGTSQRLLRRSWQRDLLDAAAGPAGAASRQRMLDAHAAWRHAADALAASRAAAASEAREVARARDVIEDLEPLALDPGEPQRLAAERLRLLNGARIASAAERIAATAGDDDGVADSLAQAVRDAAHVAALDDDVARLADGAALLVDRLRELARDANGVAAAIAVDAERLDAVERRLDTLARVERRHGSVAQALEDLDVARRLIEAVDGGSEAHERLEAAHARAAAAAAAAAVELSRLRIRSARSLERAVVPRLRALDMPHGRLRIVLTRVPDDTGLDAGDGIPVRYSSLGVDDVEFRLATNPDMLPAPLDQGPSGGELSRLALALAAEVQDPSISLLVLDEVDTGIGGETAARVGDMLAAIGAHQQVLAVTHRPEIAARAGGHIVVTKTVEAGAAVSRAGTVTGEARVGEVARLMSGRTTAAALRRAAELLDEGAPAQASRGAARARRTM